MYQANYTKGEHFPSVEPDDLREVMSRFASGVTIVTAQHEGERGGSTVSSFVSITLEPPTVMVAINNAGSLATMIIHAEHFAVHILSAEQADLSDRFAEALPNAEKYAGINATTGKTGAPVVAGSLATLECVLVQTVVIGTHTVMFGRVVGALWSPESGAPLVYYHRNYHQVAPVTAATANNTK